jgi:hypothetical protein
MGGVLTASAILGKNLLAKIQSAAPPAPRRDTAVRTEAADPLASAA